MTNPSIENLKSGKELYYIEINGGIKFHRIEYCGWKKENNGVMIHATDGNDYPLNKLVEVDKESVWEILK